MRAVLFDFGGTIDTDGVHWSEMFWDYYRRFKVRTTKKEFEAAFVESEKRIQAEEGVAGLTFEKLLQRQFALQFELLGPGVHGAAPGEMAVACYDDVRSTVARARVLLEAYKQRYLLGVVSNFYGNLEVVCREFSLDTLFTVMVDSAVVGLRKPDPAIFALALERMGVPPPEAYVVGDSYDRDIVPARVLGCSTIWLKGPSWNVPKETDSADFTITSLAAARVILLP
jgi:putative hydrolase of the HAD superfamily